MKLHELDAARVNIQRELDAILEQTGGEVTPDVDALCDRLLCLDMQTADKFDRYGHVISDLTLRASGYKERAKALAAAAAVLENSAERMKACLKEFMERHEMDRVDGEWYRFRVQKNGGKVPLVISDVDMAELPEELLRRTVEIDHGRVRAMLEAGMDLSFAKLGERGTNLRIS